MIPARAQSPAPQYRKVHTATVRSRSQTAHTECEATRSKRLRGTGRVDLTDARAAGGTDTSHVRSLHENHAKRARSMGSCILAAGLLPLLRLHCSCQGKESLTPDKSQLQHLLSKRCNARTPDFSGNSASLHGAAHLSHVVSEFSYDGMTSVCTGIESSAQALFSGLSLTPSVDTRAEGQQSSFLPTFATPLANPCRAAHGPGVFVGHQIPLTPERRGNKRDVSTQQRCHAAAVPETSGSYSRSDPREDARTPAGSDVAFPRSLRSAA